jgi:hypothetical protein
MKMTPQLPFELADLLIVSPLFYLREPPSATKKDFEYLRGGVSHSGCSPFFGTHTNRATVYRGF